MAVEGIKKAELFVHKSDLDNVLNALQKTGSYEVVPFDSDSASEGTALIHPDLQRVESLLAEARFLLRFLEPHFNDEVSPMARALGDREALSLTEGKALEERTDMMSLSGDVRALERRLIEIRSELAQISSTEVLLSSLVNFPYPFELLTYGTERVRGVLGTMPVSKIEAWRAEVEAVLSSMGEVYTSIPDEKEQEGWVAVFYEESLAEKVAESLAKHSFSRVEVPLSLKKTVEEESAAMAERKVFLTAEEEKILKEIADIAAGHVLDIRSLSDYWTVTRDRYQALSSGATTEQVVMLRGWVPESAVPRLTKALSPFGTSVELFLFKPSPEDSPPSLLVNAPWSLPFENLTRLYGVPKYGEIDPTPLLAPFFFIFFGMCLGDAGYGVITVGLFMWFTKKFKDMPVSFKGFFQLFILSGVSTIIVGALTGSWFGDMVDAFSFLSFLRPAKDFFLILNPMDNPMSFLAISLALGVIQLFFGLFIAFYDALRKKDYMGAFADVGGWIVLLVGLLLWGGVASGFLSEGMGLVAKIVSFIGAAILVATQGRAKEGIFGKAVSGVLSLYDVTSYLGDVLSYSRLLALGLATGAVGVIINMLAGLAGDIPFIGWAIAILLVVGGHIFSLAVNLLGAFVHSLRLQYVEFFSKFYSGGGTVFSPLTYKTAFVSIKSESEE
ncbi:MAG: V-type ATP synthase subunit I [Synergistaceae bacterium]|nr:V-type ATP synthase subunit I [Synergistaceae bacterium]